MLISERVDQVLRGQLGTGVTWDRNTSLRETGGLALDHLDMVELGMALEEEFALAIPEDEFECGQRIDTVGDIVDLIERRCNAKQAMFG